MNESQLTTHIKKSLLRARPDMWMIKVHGGPMQQPGVPDLIGVWQGQFIALEVKHPNSAHPVTPRQQHAIDRITAAGGLAAVVSSVAEAARVVLGDQGQVTQG